LLTISNRNKISTIFIITCVTILALSLYSVFSPSIVQVTAAPAGALPTTITVTPVEDYNPIKTQHTFTAKLLAADGTAVAGETVEWSLDRAYNAVGIIVDASGRGKVDNTYAVTTTGVDGTATVTITSTHSGDTDVIAYAPAIANVSAHKVFAVKHWIDVLAEFPGNATNTVGTEHTFSVKVTKASTGAPLSGYTVRWTIMDNDPAIVFKGAIGTVTTSITNANGIASITIAQVTPKIGENTIKMDVLYKGAVGEPIIFTSNVKKSWVSPILTITKTGPASAVLGTKVTYDIKVTNTGNAMATGLVIKDTLPQGLTYDSANGGGIAVGNVVTWNLASLGAGASASYQITAKAAKIGSWTDSVTVTAAMGLTATATATTSVVAPVLTITKTGPAKAFVGLDVIFTITVKNTGNAPATAVSVLDTLPIAGLKFVEASIGMPSGPIATVDTNAYSWNLGTMNPGESKVFTVKVTPQAAGKWTNKVSVTCAEGSTANAEAIIQVQAKPVGASIQILDSIDPIPVGSEETYTIKVTNQGDSPMHNAMIEYTLPTGGQLVSASGSYTLKGNVVVFVVDKTIEAGEVVTFTIKVKLTIFGSMISTATLSYSEFPEKVFTQEGTTVY
jgi:uncharacterized repeat protein (TIGR01451 family)